MSAALLASAPAVAEDSGRSFEIYGFVQADYIQDIGGRLDPDWDDAFRPSKICFDGACGEDGQASISVKQSRFGVKGTMPTGSTHRAAQLQVRVRPVRHRRGCRPTTTPPSDFYGEGGQILAGQTNSPLMDIDVFPNTIDYWGPSGTASDRNVQIRWTPRGRTTTISRSRSSAEQRIDRGNLRLIEGLEDVKSGTTRSARPDGAVPSWRRLGPRPTGGHPAQGRLRRLVRQSADPGQRGRLGHQPRYGVQRSARTRSSCRSSTARASRAT